MQNSSRKILIVDDEQVIRHIIELGLGWHGFEVRSAQNGRVALDLLSTYTPNLIISDISMPVMGGYDFLTAVRKDMGEHYRKIPFIFLYAKTDTSGIAEVLRHGADDSLTKPFDLAELIKRVYSLIDKICLEERVNPQPDFAGKLAEISLPDILNLLEIGRKTGTLTIESRTEQNAYIYLHNGFIVGAQTDSCLNHDALYHLLLHTGETFSFYTSEDVTKTMEPMSVTHFLIEGMRFIDEWSEYSSYIPGNDTRLHVKTAEISGVKEYMDDPYIFKLCLNVKDQTMSYAELLEISPIGKTQTELTIAKMIAKGLFLFDQSGSPSIVALANQSHTCPFRHSSFYLTGCGMDGTGFTDNLMESLKIPGTCKKREMGIATYYYYDMSECYGFIRFCIAKENRSYHPMLKTIIKNSEVALFFYQNATTDCSAGVEDFLISTTDKIRVVFIAGSCLKFNIHQIAEKHNCKHYYFNDHKEIEAIFDELFVHAHQEGVTKKAALAMEKTRDTPRII